MSVSVAARYHFHPIDGADALPEVWRDLDRTVARWVFAHGGSKQLARVAGWASFAEGNGDSALPLVRAEVETAEPLGIDGQDAPETLAPMRLAQLDALRSEPLVSNVIAGEATASNTPFLIDGGHFYLRRNYLHEVAIAAQLRQRRESPLLAGKAGVDDLDALFHGVVGAHVQPQRDAVASVLGKRLFVLTGGPGTGKTTTVLRMLMMLASDHAAGGVPEPVIRISAPTGKAAQRLSESMRDGAKRMRDRPADLPPGAVWQPLGEVWTKHLDCALRAEASTLHRMLGSRGRHGGFTHHAGNPIPADIVLVDEASMVDLVMLRALLDALKPDTTLILVGDADQLTSVGTGSVLLDLVSAMEPVDPVDSDDARGTQRTDLPDLVRLSHSFRADRSLVPINEAIRVGNRQAFDAACQAAGDKVTRSNVESPVDLAKVLGPWIAKLRNGLDQSGVFAAIPTTRHDLVAQAIDGLRERQILCALRESEFGGDQVNDTIERALRHKLDAYRGETWYPGRAVMIVRNDYTVGLFNGDVGVCLRDTDNHLSVWFEVAASVEAGGDAIGNLDAGQATRRFAQFAPGSLPAHKGAFAVTIHKSQGSEYEHVAVLLPPDAANRILSRQLLYTGVSRARQGLELWSSNDALEAALGTPVRRQGRLAARLGLPR